jgi:hypothetical protein
MMHGTMNVTFHCTLLMQSSQFSYRAAVYNSTKTSDFFPLLHTPIVSLPSPNSLHFQTLHLASSPPARRTNGYGMATFRLEKFIFLTSVTLNVALLITPFFFFYFFYIFIFFLNLCSMSVSSCFHLNTWIILLYLFSLISGFRLHKWHIRFGALQGIRR